MPNIKVTIFQKKLDTPITKEQKEKLISQKSDFLVLPEFYFGNSPSSIDVAYENEKLYLDKVYEISDYYKGIVIGGSIFRKIESGILHACPLVKDIALIDWYTSRTSIKVKNIETKTSETESIFILNGIRFFYNDWQRQYE